MKHAEDIDRAIWPHQIGDAVMAIKENADVALRALVALTHFRKVDKQLSTIVDSLDSFRRGLRIVLGDVLEDVFRASVPTPQPRLLLP